MKRFALLALLASCVGPALAAETPIRLARPGFPPPAQALVHGHVGLALVSSQPAPIVNEAGFVRRNHLDLREFRVPGASTGGLPLAPLPRVVPTTYAGLSLVRAIRQHDTFLLVYGVDFASGRVLVGMRPDGRVRYALDFAAYANAPADSVLYQELVWAAEAGGVLYVETAHSTFARSSGGHNAYLTAIDLATHKVRWRSPALVANAWRFELVAGVVVTGYGFTEEPDYLYLLSRRTGAPLARLLVPTAPDFIVRKGGLLYVRTYDHGVVAKLVPA